MPARRSASSTASSCCTAAASRPLADDRDRRHPSAVARDAWCAPHVVDFGDPWDFGLVYGALHDFARAYPFDPDREDYLVHVTTGTHVAQICLFLLTETRYFPARLLQTAPPKRQRATEPGSVHHHRSRSLEVRPARGALPAAAARGPVVPQGGHRDAQPALQRRSSRGSSRSPASSRAPLLLTGPTGAGKSKLARRIYELKKARQRVTGPFVEVNCATVRGDAAMSTLFGHVRGSFTGALRDRPGLLRAADGGVLFLDEIGELGPDEQAALLRAIEDKQFLPLGADREVRSDFQLIAGTNADLPAAVRRGRFREDLLARINLWTFRLPGLRERPEDIEPNLDHELANCVAGDRRPHLDEPGGARAVSRLRDVGRGDLARQLPRLQRRAACAWPRSRPAAGSRARSSRRRSSGCAPRGATASGTESTGDLLEAVLAPETLAAIDPFDRVQLAEVVRVCRASRTLSDAGRRLFAASRTRKAAPNDADRLRKYLARFGLEWSGLRETAARPRA